MKRPAISLIIGYYNGASTLPRLLESVLDNSDVDLEVVAVDDGSDDGSQAIIERMLGGRVNLKMLSTGGRCGLARGRAIAFENATGEYLIAADADDCLEPGALGKMLEATDGMRIDTVVAPFVMDCDGAKRRIDIDSSDFNNLNSLKIETVNFSLCNKLLRRRIVVDNGLKSDVDRWEDLMVVSRYLALKPSVVKIDTPVYNYVRNTGEKSLSRDSQRRLLEDHIAVARKVDEWMIQRGLDREYAPFLNYLKLIAKVKFLKCRPRDVKSWRDTFPEVNARVMDVRQLGAAYRIGFRLVDMFPRVSQSIADLLGLAGL